MGLVCGEVPSHGAHQERVVAQAGETVRDVGAHAAVPDVEGVDEERQ